MASNVRQNRSLEAYCCLRGLPEASFASKNEVTSDFCLAPFITSGYDDNGDYLNIA